MKRLADILRSQPDVYVPAHDAYRRLQYALDRTAHLQNVSFRRQKPPDGLPMPSPYLVYLVTGQFSLEYYYRNGLLGAECIRSILAKNGLDINAFGAILDFGCGCGRVLRQWKNLTGPKIYGCDYNPLLVRWSEKAFAFANIAKNHGTPPLPYGDKSFDFVYSISVFTHLPAVLQVPWLRELARVLKPEGYLLTTVHGATAASKLDARAREIFDAGELVVVGEDYRGTNLCAAFHPERYIRQVFCKILTVVDYVPDGAKDAGQDQILFRNLLTTRPTSSIGTCP